MTLAPSGRSGLRHLAILRYVILLGITGASVCYNRRFEALPTAIGVSVIFSATFLVSLRFRAALGNLSGSPGKPLSWSAALLGATIVSSCADHLLDPAHFYVLVCTQAVQLLVFYTLGKATCHAAGCCRSTILPGPLDLPTIEAIVSGGLILAAFYLAEYGTGPKAIVEILVLGHLFTRLASRLLRSQGVSSFSRADIVFLVIVAAVLAWPD